MFHRILVGYDGSQRSEDALALAHGLAGAHASVTAACAYWWQPLSARIAKSAPGEMKLRAEAEHTLAPLHARPGRLVRTVPAAGVTPAQALHDLLEERDYDLVVVGSTHRGAAGRVLAGTTADALLHGGSWPVAVAPLGYRDRPPQPLRSIGVAFDGSDASQAALAAAHVLAAEHGAQLVVLRSYASVPVLAAGDVGYGVVVDVPEMRAAAGAELDEAVAGLTGAVDVSAELLDGDPGEALAGRSGSLDLIVAGSKGHNALGRVLLGSVSHHLMCHALSPVLVVPPRGH